MAKLRIREGVGKGQVHEVAGTSIVIGREADCAVRVMDKGASRRHAEVFKVGQMCFIRDLGSRNGTFVNDERVTEELLREGDVIVIGNATLKFEADRRADPERNITFTESAEEELGSTLELRLDDLAGLEEEDDRDTANFRAIYQLGRTLGGERSAEAAQRKALAFLAELVPAEQIYLFARDTSSGALVPRARFERNASAKAKVSRTIIRRCLSETRSILTMNAMSDARFRSNESVVLKGIRSVICVPMVSQGELSGVLYLSSANISEPFAEEDLELVTAAATLLGLTVESLEVARRQRETLFSAMRALVAVSEARDEQRRGHSERVAGYALAVAEQLALPEKRRMNVRLAALLHDVGRAAVAGGPESTTETRKLRRGDPGTQHAARGAEIAAGITGADEVAPAVRHHHEAFDGSGYPDGLAGEGIPLAARIVAAADVLDHLVSSGHEGRGMSLDVAADLLRERAGRELDPDVVEACQAALRAGRLAAREALVPAGKAGAD